MPPPVPILFYASPDGGLLVYVVGGDRRDVAPKGRDARALPLRNALYDMAERGERMPDLCEAHGQRRCCGR